MFISSVQQGVPKLQRFIPAAVFILCVVESDEEEVLTCSNVLQYHVSHLSTGAHVFAKPSLFVRFAGRFF